MMKSSLRRKIRPLFIAVMAIPVISSCGLLGGSRAGPIFIAGGAESNGERIYFTGTNDRGERIRYSGGPPFGGMMMTYSLTCASCHGLDGRGGVHTMHMQVMDAPDIRWSTLSSGEHGDHGGGLEDDHDETAYDRDSFFRVIREGIEPSGHSLSSDMPRWRLSDNDLNDLLLFLKQLP